jgi:3-deoxy-manno-octulosonate cytidylyltransferase (CMP-KDO synthetase)
MFYKVDHMHFIGIIPARYASKRFPGKALADIGGKPMVIRVYEQAKKVFEKVYVATDDQRIFDVVRKFEGNVVMTSAAHKSGTDRCAEAILTIEKNSGETFDVVVNIQGDEPFIAPRQLELVKSCFDEPHTQIATLIKKIGSLEDLLDPNRPKVLINRQQEALYFSRAPVPYIRGRDRSAWLSAHDYYMHIGLYGFRKEVLFDITRLVQSPLEVAESLEQLRWIENGYRISVRVTEFESFGIDTPEDLERLKARGFKQPD